MQLIEGRVMQSFSRCRITVLRRSLDEELIAEFLDEKHAGMKRCEGNTEGQEFLVTELFGPPEGFCP